MRGLKIFIFFLPKSFRTFSCQDQVSLYREISMKWETNKVKDGLVLPLLGNFKFTDGLRSAGLRAVSEAIFVFPGFV